MGDTRTLRVIEQLEHDTQNDKAFTFEQQLNQASGNMEQASIKALTGFRQQEMEIEIKLELAATKIEEEPIRELEQEFNQFISSSIGSKQALSTEYGKSERPKDAKHIWDHGKEFDKRTAYRQNLTTMDHYIDDAIERIGNRFKKVRNNVLHQSQPYIVPAVSILDDNDTCQHPEETSEYQDIMGFDDR